MAIKGFGEDRLIRDLSRGFGQKSPRVVMGVGDDTSVTTQNPGRVLLATTDILVEGRHFLIRSTPACLLGKKALAVSLSDIAAMGGEPVFFLVSIGIPPYIEKSYLDGLYTGLRAQSKKYSTPLAGGNTSGSSELIISTTVIGEMHKKEVLYRGGARHGDLIFVTGTLGGSAHGLTVLKDQGYDRAVKGLYKTDVLKHLDPAPRLSVGRALAAGRISGAMIDISDGLMLDLGRIGSASGVGAVVESDRLPLSPGLRRLKRLGPGPAKKALGLALSGGEEYELLFTASRKALRMIDGIAHRSNVRITRIGMITDKSSGVKAVDSLGRTIRLKKQGFEHF